MIAFLLPLLAQASTDAVDPSGFRYPTTRHAPVESSVSSAALAPPQSAEQDRLTVCLKQTTDDPAGAAFSANGWILETSGAERSYARQCLGMAYTVQQKWQSAEDAFLAGRADTPADNPGRRARLAAMAGNSALADGRNDNALADLGMAAVDATGASDTILGGEIEIDRARALVALGKTGEAGAALEKARREAPQNSDAWLLSATLARRGGDLATAQSHIATAAGLDPTNPQIDLEAGVIAALGGKDDAARKSFQSVIQLWPGSPDADTAKTYLAQLDPPPAEGITP
ncbi:MAG: tetratricopeptide repeat protein [Candidatus Andeanibacterium colombiense]|uniref:Tetratricopeptide repeat protein n=1 Tax=Candidatus Andeanibacterium colombiense TaxID=3121345 RepID=A0AAJ5X4A1_9SPHN|nr:MAG: tetratricopeptide repeat protein [Sphingomonadaceae bacterium]